MRKELHHKIVSKEYNICIWYIEHFESLSHTNINSEQRENSFVLKLFVQRYQAWSFYRYILRSSHLCSNRRQKPTSTLHLSLHLWQFMSEKFFPRYSQGTTSLQVSVSSPSDTSYEAAIGSSLTNRHRGTSTPLFYKTLTFNVESRRVSLL